MGPRHSALRRDGEEQAKRARAVDAALAEAQRVLDAAHALGAVEIVAREEAGEESWLLRDSQGREYDAVLESDYSQSELRSYHVRHGMSLIVFAVRPRDERPPVYVRDPQDIDDVVRMAGEELTRRARVDADVAVVPCLDGELVVSRRGALIERTADGRSYHLVADAEGYPRGRELYLKGSGRELAYEAFDELALADHSLALRASDARPRLAALDEPPSPSAPALESDPTISR